MAGGKRVIVNSSPNSRSPAAKVEAAVTPRTKILILNSPSNPTGVVMTESEVKAAVEIARKHDLLIVSDEIYEPFLYEGKGDRGQGTGLASPAKLYDNTLILRGFSKSHAMTGWRLGD